MPNDDQTAPVLADELEVLRVFAAAHDVPGRDGTREPIYFLQYHGDLMHHALPEDRPLVDEALITEMHFHGLLDLDYSGDGTTWKLRPTALAREVLREDERTRAALTASAAPISEVLENQATAANPLAWPAVRPVLEALNQYWRESGYPAEGIALIPIAKSVEPRRLPLFAATIRTLVAGEYLVRGQLWSTLTDDEERPSQFPAEIALTEKAHAILDGWPGAAPSELVDNLIAVLTAEAEAEPDPQKKRRLHAAVDAVRELGVAVTSEVLAKVIAGGA